MGVFLQFMNWKQGKQIKCHTAHGIRMAFCWILKHIVKAAHGLFLRKVYRGLDSRGFQIGIIFRQVHNLPGALIIAGAYQVSSFIIAQREIVQVEQSLPLVVVEAGKGYFLFNEFLKGFRD